MREQICRRIIPLAQEFKKIRIGGVNFWIKGEREGGVEEAHGIEYDVPSENWNMDLILSAVEGEIGTK